MHVALCDDESHAMESLRVFLEQHPLVRQVRCFPLIDRFFDAMEDGEQFDLVFMDIDWPGEKNGIDFASALSGVSPQTQIIYVTGHNDRFCQQIFLKQANLCGYLVKPVDSTLLNALLEKADHAIQAWAEQKLLIQQKGVVHAIPYREICYLDSQGHQLTVHTRNDSILCYERLEEIKQRLPDQFLQCHKSFLVNMDVIRRVDKNRILLKTGEEIPISKAKYAQTRTAYFRYMGASM